MAKRVKRKAPSRARYEQSHPTVSCRVSEENKSFADVLKIGLGILEVQAKEEGEIRKRARARGYKEGYADAERTYKVTYPCAICAKTIVLTFREAKEAASKYMQEHGWGHKECHEKRR